jgi:hypothetical protein
VKDLLPDLELRNNINLRKSVKALGTLGPIYSCHVVTYTMPKDRDKRDFIKGLEYNKRILIISNSERIMILRLIQMVGLNTLA